MNKQNRLIIVLLLFIVVLTGIIIYQIASTDRQAKKNTGESITNEQISGDKKPIIEREQEITDFMALLESKKFAEMERFASDTVAYQVAASGTMGNVSKIEAIKLIEQELAKPYEFVNLSKEKFTELKSDYFSNLPASECPEGIYGYTPSEYHSAMALCIRMGKLESLYIVRNYLSEQNVLIKIKEEGFLVRYSGSITVSGIYRENYPETMLGGELCFYADDKSGYLIPRDSGDRRNPWFCFNDQDEVKAQFGIDDAKIFADPAVKCISGNATVQVSDYVVNKMESSVFDTAALVKIISKDNYSTQCE